jgi:predicted metal-binding membrane protein
MQARLAGAGVALVGLYGLSPLASTCLRACRRPFGFLARYWRGGGSVRLQAALIGAAYGLSCVGCCIPMIAIMFIVGMGHMAIIVILAVMMVVMKSSAGGTWLARLLALALIGAGVAIGTMWVPVAMHHH